MSDGNCSMWIDQIPNALKKRKFVCGELIVRAEPYAHVISMAQNGKYCDWCASPPKTNKLRKCSVCQYEHYCDRRCQKSAWKYHKFECPLIKARLPRIPADSVRLLTKIIWNIGHGINRPTDDPGWRVWNDLCHHSNILRTDDERSKQWVEVSATILQYVGFENMKKNGMFCVADMMPEFGRMVFNGYTLTSMSQEIGAAVYISPSVFNHSCIPNAAHVTIGTTVFVRALRDIDTSQEAIVVNYIDPMQRRQTRQSYLWKEYYFHCTCQKCSDVTGEALLESTICSKCGGDVVINVDDDEKCECHDCKSVIDDAHYISSCEKSAVEAEKLCEEASKVASVDIEPVKKFLSANSLLSKKNVCLTMVKHTFYNHLSLNGDPLEAYNLGKELSGLFTLYYPKVYPIHGDHMFRQARLAWQLDMYDDALDLYRRSLACLLLTHGPKHPLTIAVKSDIPECERDKFIFNKTVT